MLHVTYHKSNFINSNLLHIPRVTSIDLPQQHNTKCYLRRRNQNVLKPRVVKFTTLALKLKALHKKSMNRYACIHMYNVDTNLMCTMNDTIL